MKSLLQKYFGKKDVNCVSLLYPNERIENLACKIHLSEEELLKPTYFHASNWEFLFLVLIYS